MRKSIFILMVFMSTSYAYSICSQFPDGERPRINKAFADAFGYQETLPDPQNPGKTIPNPETRGQFCKRMIASFVKDVVAGSEVKEAAEAAAAARSNASSLDVQ